MKKIADVLMTAAAVVALAYATPTGAVTCYEDPAPAVALRKDAVDSSNCTGCVADVCYSYSAEVNLYCGSVDGGTGCPYCVDTVIYKSTAGSGGPYGELHDLYIGGGAVACNAGVFLTTVGPVYVCERSGWYKAITVVSDGNGSSYPCGGTPLGSDTTYYEV